MKHVFFIDPLEKLNIKKDSTLMLALTAKNEGLDAYVLFEDDFYVNNEEESKLKVFPFEGEFKTDGHYLDSFILSSSKMLEMNSDVTIHMRIDPPYDTRYQRYLWMLNFLSDTKSVKVLNNPLGIMKYNEKLVAYRSRAYGHESYVGSSKEGFIGFVEILKTRGYDSIILKPLDLYSGIGVEKVDVELEFSIPAFEKKIKEFQGAIVCQPFIKDVYKGELRSIYFDGKEIGTIIKKPNEGEFLANIAQGAKFEKIGLTAELKEICDSISDELLQDDVRLVAFDLLGGMVNEVNITCPGLMVEVSYAYDKNICLDIIKSL